MDESAPITFRRLRREDFPRLGQWLAQPHVARWWNHETSAEAVERDFGASADGAEPNQDWLARLGREPVGLLQYSWYRDYPDYRRELAAVVEVPERAAGLDYLIGDPDRIGRGLGPAMISAFVTRVWSRDPEVSCLLVPVVAANRRSWRALQKAGFTVVASGELEPDNPVDDREHVVLRIDRPEE